MKAIETIMDVKENGDFFIRFPQKVKPGSYKIVIVVEDEIIEETNLLPPEIDNAYKNEIDKRLEEMENDSNPGFTMKDVLDELEVELGRKIPTRTIS